MKFKVIDYIDGLVIVKHVVRQRGEVFKGYCVKILSMESKYVLDYHNEFVNEFWFDNKKQVTDFVNNLGKYSRENIVSRYRKLNG